MRIVSNHLLFRLIVRNEIRQFAQDDRGILRGYSPTSELTLEFSRNGITAHDMAFGMQTWMNSKVRSIEVDGIAYVEANDPFKQEAWGAHPDTRDGAAGGHIYRAWDPRQQFSVFDTNSLGGQDKVDAEAFFTAHPQSPDYIVVEKTALKPPWPSYDETQWKKIAPLARELGFVAEAVAYEEAKDEPRPAVLAALREQHAAAVEEALEDEALKVIVP